MCTYMSIGTRRGQKRVVGALQLELEVVVNCFMLALGTKLKSPARIECALNS